MLIDTHCHLNTMIKNEFDAPLPHNFSELVQPYLDEAGAVHVTRIINVGTSLMESINCVILAKEFKNIWATLGTHPNDLTADWKSDIVAYKKILQSSDKERIVGIGEIGLDYHYPDFDKQRQYDGFRAQIELALEHDLPIVIHTRDAADETLHVIEEYKQNNIRGIIHCFSENAAFARYARELGFLLGIGGPLTYPKNQYLRDIFMETPLESIVLETDAPFLPPQYMRGKKNTPAQIAYIAQFLADLKGISLPEVAHVTTQNALNLFRI
jgi:TatD DNase family protein